MPIKKPLRLPDNNRLQGGPVSRETETRLLLEILKKQLASFPDVSLAPFETHYQLLCQWNATHNLTRITSPGDVAEKHYLDSLMPLFSFLSSPQCVVDIGSGNGLPGLAAAVLWPKARTVLIESSAKKVSFLKTLRNALNEVSFDIVQERCETAAPQNGDLVITRATFPWRLVPRFARRHLALHGSLVAYLGREAPTPEQWVEVASQSGLVNARVETYRLGSTQMIRHLAKATLE